MRKTPTTAQTNKAPAKAARNGRPRIAKGQDRAPKPQVSAEPLTTGLGSRAMLVNLSIGFWEGRKKDKTTASEVLTKEGADTDAGAFWIYTLPKSAIQPVLNARLHARECHLKYTLPWYDDGQRVLPAAMFTQYTSEMRERKVEFEKAVNVFLGEYPTIAADAATRLGGLADNVNMPTAQEIRNKFPWRMLFYPLPQAEDFRVDLGDEATREIQADIKKQTEDAMALSMRYLWDRLHAALVRIVDRLSDAKGVFRDTLISNLVEICELLPGMNVTGSTELETARQAVMQKLAGKDPQVLRDNATVRSDTAKAAADILATVTDFLGIPPHRPLDPRPARTPKPRAPRTTATAAPVADAPVDAPTVDNVEVEPTDDGGAQVTGAYTPSAWQAVA